MNAKSSLVNLITSTESKDISNILLMKGMIFSYVSPVSYLDALNHKELFSRMDGLFVDGSLMAAAVHICYGKHITRRSPDMVGFFPEVFENASKWNKSICVVGSSQQQMEMAVKKFSTWYPGIVWEKCRNGFFSGEQEMKDYAVEIAKAQPDYLICGMGSVIQERFLLLCKEAGYKGVGFSCGGFIRQIAENDNDSYYPAWINRMNLRFLYRMYKEPHTRKRYAIAGLVFPVRFMWERIFG